MNSKKFKILVLFIGMAFVQSGCTKVLGDMPEESKPIPVVSSLVKSRNISHTIELSGVIESENMSLLSSKTSGRVEAIYFDIGDRVRKGDIIVSLFGDENRINFSTAESIYQNTLVNMESTHQLMNAWVESAKRKIDTAMAELNANKDSKDHIKAISNQQIILSKEKVKLAEIAIQNISNTSQQESINIDSQKKRLISQSVILSYGVLDHIRSLVGSDNRDLRYEDISHRLGQKNQQSIWTIIRKLQSYQQSVEDFKIFYDEKIDKEEVIDLEEGFELSKKALNNATEILDTFHQLLLDTIPSYSFSRERLEEARQSLVAYGQKVESLMLSVSGGQTIGLNGLTQSEEIIKVSKENQLRQAEHELIMAKESLLLVEGEASRQINEADNRVIMSETQLEQSKGELITAKSNLKSQMQMLKTQVAQSKGARDLAAMALENTLVKAPFDGLVIEKKVDIGTVVGPGVPLINFADPNSMKIKVMVPAKEAVSIKMGTEASIFSDLLTGKIFKTTISKIGKHSDPLTKKVPIELVFKGKTDGLRIGMFVRVSIYNEDKKSKVIIPQRSVLMKGEEAYVYVLQKKKAYLIPVRLGDIFGNYYEVLSGVYPGNQIVTKGIENLYNEAPVLNVD